VTDALHDLVYVVAVLPAVVVARRYRQLPSVIPISVRPNGAPIARGPRWLLIFPALLVAVLLPLAALTLHVPGARMQSEAGAVLMYILLIEVAAFVALILGLEAEVAVGKLRRFPALVQYVAGAVLLATFVLTLVQA
jgi:hypothetical protein